MKRFKDCGVVKITNFNFISIFIAQLSINYFDFSQVIL